jgi:hypothetical protein
MGAIAFVVIAVVAFLAWGLIRIGIRIGEAKTSRYLAEALIRYLGLKSDSEEIKEINQSLKDYGPWYIIGGNREDNTDREMRLSDIGGTCESRSPPGRRVPTRIRCNKTGRSNGHYE